MNILILSDTHGDINKALEMYYRLKPEYDFDTIIHCGDYEKDASAISDAVKLPVFSVPGNCDRSHSEDAKVIETPAGNILITHGHIQNVNYGYDRLLYLAEEKNCELTVFGHTHVAMFEDFDGIMLFNPGSLSRPRDNSGGTCGVIIADEDGFRGFIKYYEKSNDPNIKKSSKRKVRGGYLRGLLNYSDGF